VEQKEIIDKFIIKGEVNLQKLLQTISQLSSDKLNVWLEHSGPLKGEVNL